MKKFLWALAFVLLSSGVSAPADPGKPTSPSLTAEEILSRYLDSIGGTRLKDVKTIVKKSEGVRGESRWQFTIYRQAPDRYAIFTTHPKGNQSAAGFDGTTLWVLPSKPLEPNQEIGFEWHLERTPIATEFHIRPYRKVKLLGTKNVGDTKAYVIELYQAEAERHVYYIDTHTFLLLRMDSTERYKLGPGSSIQKDTRGSYLSQSTTYYSDWRKLDGVMLPFEARSTESFQGHDDHGQTYHQGQESITRVIECRVDSPVDDKLFAPPPGSVKRTVK